MSSFCRLLRVDIILAIIIVVAVAVHLSSRIGLHFQRSVQVPGVGYGSIPYIGSWQGAIAFFLWPRYVVQAGYERYRNGIFKMSDWQREYVVVSDQSKISEYLSAPDNVMSIDGALEEIIQGRWTIGHDLWDSLYHISHVRTKFAPSMVGRFEGMQEEVSTSLDQSIGAPQHWSDLKIYWAMATTIARVSHFAFGGVEMSRNTGYIFNSIHYPQASVISAEVLKFLPQRIKRYALWLTPAQWSIKLADWQIGPYLQARINEVDRNEKPRNDMLQWLIENAPPGQRNREELLRRMWSLNLGSLHTSAITITSAIHMLAREADKYVPELRAEIDEHCPGGVFSKTNLDRLIKLDSFLRETCRLNDFAVAFVNRKAKTTFVFKDGTVVPKGAILSAPKYSIHRDPRIYSNPDTFDGLRFYRMRDDSQGQKCDLTTTSLDFLYFGHGKHACAGRFFAAMELKLIMANLLLRYDFALSPRSRETVRYIGAARIPNYGLKIHVRTRRSSDIGVRTPHASSTECIVPGSDQKAPMAVFNPVYTIALRILSLLLYVCRSI